MTDYSTRRTFWLLAVACLISAGGCKTKSGSGPEQVVSMGSTVAVGGLKYTVFQTEWKENLEGPQGVRTPKNRYMLLHLAVENASGDETGIPMFQLVNEKGELFDEENNGNGVTDWLGYLRTAKANSSERGTVLFDVPQTGYKLRVSSGGDDPEKEKTALVDIPLRVDVDQPAASLPVETQPPKQ